MCVIITEAAEDNDGRNNSVANAHGENPENNHRKEREKIYVSTGDWRMFMLAMNHSMAIPADSRREVLMGYQYALHQHKKKLLQEKRKLWRSHESNNVSSRPQWEEYSGTSKSSEERHREPKHNRRRTERPIKESHAKNSQLIIFNSR
jgi:predicted phage gp36 major capsid-like protein